MPAAVTALGLLSVAMLIWTDQISQRQRAHFAIANAIMDLRLAVATSRLWFEEALPGGTNAVVNMERAWSDFREATRLSEAILYGGETEHGLVVHPPKKPELRRRAEDIRRVVSEFGRIFHEGRDPLRPGSLVATHYDQIFRELQRVAQNFETIVETNQATDSSTSRRLFSGALLAWSSILTALATGLFRRERSLGRADALLRRDNIEWEARVRERTSELARAIETVQAEVSERKRAEANLQDLFDTVPVGLFVSTPTGQLLAANPAIVQTLGYPDAQTLIQVNAADLYVEKADRERWQLQVERHGFIRGEETQVRRRDGSSIYVRLSVHATRDAQGRVLHYQGVAEDITQHRLAREMQSRPAALG